MPVPNQSVDLTRANDDAYRAALLAVAAANRWENCLPYYCESWEKGERPYTLKIKLRPEVDKDWFLANRIPLGYMVTFL